MQRLTVREDWLIQAVHLSRAIFDAKGRSLPAKVRISCGFPSTFTRSQTLAECWADTDSADGAFEIMISPTLADSRDVLAQVVGALAHALPGAMSPTSQAYAEACADMGLSPVGDSWRKVIPSEDFSDLFDEVIESLGEYPHAALLAGTRKVQSTRMLKAQCPKCGYTVRLSGKWAAVGLPLCPTDGATFNLGA